MEHRVTDECLSIFNVNGVLVKNQKSKLLEMLNFKETIILPTNEDITALVDMGFVWRLVTPTSEDREENDGTNFSWGDYAKKMLNMIVQRHPVVTTVDSCYLEHALSRTSRYLEHRAISNIALSRTKLSVPLASIQAEQLLVISNFPISRTFYPVP